MQQPLPAATERAWPSLREDLTLHEGSPDATGAPSWTLHDPARNQYFSIDWIAFQVLARLGLGDAASVVQAIRSETTLIHIEESDVWSVIQFLEENELVQRHGAQASSFLKARREARKAGFWQSLIHNYLFFRVPLFRVDALLGKLVPQVQFLWRPVFFQITAAAFLLGLWGAIRQWDVFTATLVDTFSWSGLIGFAGALIAVKVLHELGHGLTAKRFGCRVPYMGVAFLVMWPMAYTDVTESWKLDSHRKRLIISAAGIVTELVVAAWALLAWSALPDGGLRSAAFFLATTSIVATLAINTSPFMRFDGYFLLCDVLGISNLHQRSFALARWWLREKLFRLGDPAPEQFSKNQESFLVAFAFVTWVYRLVVFFGIALLVYAFFFKLLGIVALIIELWYFIARPVWREFVEWRKRWDEIGPQLRHRPAFYIGVAIAAVLLLPLDFRINTQGLLKPASVMRVISFQPSQIVALPPAIGTKVSAGQPLMAMESPALEHKIRQAQVKVQILQRQFQVSGFDPESRVQQGVLKERLSAALEELRGLEAERERLRPVMAFNGRVVDRDPDLSAGVWVPRSAHVATVVSDESWVVDAYVNESDLDRIDIGYWARFVPQGVGLSGGWGRVMSIDADATRVMTDLPLASIAGGQVLVREQNQKIVPERAVYRVRIQLNEKPVGDGLGMVRGSVAILGYPKSLAGDIVRGAINTVVREAGF